MSLTGKLVSWSWEQKCQKAVEVLGTNGFTALYCTTGAEALKAILELGASAQSVGFGGSMTVADLGVLNRFEEMGKEILNHSRADLSLDQKMEVMRRQLTCDLFLCGTNALTLNGELINIDATGNRAAAMFFGPKRVIVVAGRNKLVDGTTIEAIHRVKQWATPPNAKRLNFNTPCAKTGFCSNCNSPDRLCRVTTVIDRKPRFTDLIVLVVNEDMGF